MRLLEAGQEVEAAGGDVSKLSLRDLIKKVLGEELQIGLAARSPRQLSLVMSGGAQAMRSRGWESPCSTRSQVSNLLQRVPTVEADAQDPFCCRCSRRERRATGQGGEGW